MNHQCIADDSLPDSDLGPICETCGCAMFPKDGHGHFNCDGCSPGESYDIVCLSEPTTPAVMQWGKSVMVGPGEVS